MAEPQAKTEDITTDVTNPKPPLQSSLSAANSAKSDSFRGVDYVAPDDAHVAKSQSLGIGGFLRRLTTTSRPPVKHASSEKVLDELARNNARTMTRANSKDLPPLASQSPRVVKTDSGRVGLPSVKLVATETPSEEPAVKKETEEEQKTEQTEVHTPAPPPTGEEEAVESTEEKSKEATGFGTPISTSGQLTSDELPAEVAVEPETQEQESTDATTATVEAAVDQTMSEGITITEQPVETETVAAAEPPAVVENPATETPEAGEPPVMTAAGSAKEFPTSAPERELRASKTMAATQRSQRNIFQRLFTFGGGGSDRAPSVQASTDVSVVEETPETPVTPVPSEAAPEVVPPTEETPTEEIPSAETEPVVEAEVESSPTPTTAATMHNRVASDLNPDELESLKATFMTEMKQKGIEVEGKYTKSSRDFDSPLMFLLDLHTFAETQHAAVRMEHLLEEKYGAGNPLVTEFNAAAREQETATEATTTEPEPETQPPTDEKDTPTETPVKDETATATTAIYETGLDTAEETAVAEEAKETETPEVEMTESLGPIAASSSESQTENKENVAAPEETTETTKPVAEMESETAPREPAPQIPPVHNEAEAGRAKAGCFLCRCLAPNAS